MAKSEAEAEQIVHGELFLDNITVDVSVREFKPGKPPDYGLTEKDGDSLPFVGQTDDLSDEELDDERTCREIAAEMWRAQAKQRWEDEHAPKLIEEKP